MEFTVKRTSVWSDEPSPCEGAYKSEICVVDTRTLASFDDFESRFGESFFARGTNHRLTPDGCISRDLGTRPFWKIKIQDLEHLKKFSEEHGSLVFSGEHIEIYDDYRE